MPNSIGVAAYFIGLISVITAAVGLHGSGALGPWYLALVFVFAVLLGRAMAYVWPLRQLGEPSGETIRHLPFVVFCVVINFLVARPLMFLIAWRIAEWLPASLRSSISDVQQWILVPVCLLIYEAGGYLHHRIFHRVGLLWRFAHSVHHEPTRYGTFLSLRLHYFEYFFLQLTRLLLLHVIGIDPGIILVVVSISLFAGVMQHVDTTLRFGWLNHFIFTPETHMWHHDPELRVNYGFGLLTLFDKIGGTFWYPSGRLPEQLGILGWRARGLLDATLCRSAPPPSKYPSQPRSTEGRPQ